jgi:hypothetical protein
LKPSTCRQQYRANETRVKLDGFKPSSSSTNRSFDTILFPSHFELDGLKPSSLNCGMSKPERAVLDVLFPEVRAKLLRLFFSTPPKQRYVRELVNMSGLTLHTVQDELRKLSAVGLLTNWSNGYHRFYRANRDHPMYPKLVGIVQLSETLPHAKSSALERSQGPIFSESADPTPTAGAAPRSASELAPVRAAAQNSTALSRRV